MARVRVVRIELADESAVAGRVVDLPEGVRLEVIGTDGIEQFYTKQEDGKMVRETVKREVV